MYYDQIEAVALPYVQAFQTDITEHDKPALADYTGDIVYAMRESGTNLILLTDDPIPQLTAEFIEAFTFGPNERYFIGAKGKLREVKRNIALDTWQRHRKQYETNERGPHPLFAG